MSTKQARAIIEKAKTNKGPKPPKERKPKAKAEADPWREFAVTYVLTVRVRDSVIKEGLSKEFADYIYPMANAEEVATHVAYNLGRNRLTLDQIDGLAEHAPEKAELTSWDHDFTEEVK